MIKVIGNFKIGTFCLLVFLLIANIAIGEQVTQEMAQQVAQAFLLKEQTLPPKVATKIEGEFINYNPAAELTLGEIQPIIDENGLIIAYIQILKPKGFFIIASDDDINPMICFSFENNFTENSLENNPLIDLVKEDLNRQRNLFSNKSETTEVIQYITRNKVLWKSYLNIAHSGQYTLEPDSLESKKAVVWGPWLQTDWYQTGHYNNKCPYLIPNVSGLRRVAGCVAIAMAQIVNYWKYPKAIVFSNDDYYTSNSINIFQDSTKYGFPSLSELNSALNTLDYNSDSEEEAYLCFGIGVKAKMEYGVGGSGAYSWRAATAFRKELDFGQAAYDYNPEGVFSKYREDIIRNIKDAWPVYFGISDHLLPSFLMSGHAVVCDGYRESDGYFHINLGWEVPSLWNVWYNLPNIAGYSVVNQIIYDISKYQGWNQLGADQRNSYYSIYSAPIGQPIPKWPVNIPSDLLSSYHFGHLIIGTGGRMYVSLNPNSMGGSLHPYIVIYDKYGTREKLIEITNSNTVVRYLCQNSRGEIFFVADGGNITTSKLFRLNPKTDIVTAILTHSNPDDGLSETPIKVDRDDYLYFVIQARYTGNYGKLYAVSRTGAYKWTPYSFPSSAQFHISAPAIDEDRDRVYLNYWDGSIEKSRLLAFRRSDGAVVFDEILPNIPTHSASEMACAPAIGKDGTVYIGAYTSLYAYSSNGTKLWEKSFHPAYTNRTPAIGNSGVLYVNYGKMVNSNWQPGHLRALNSSNGNEKWDMALPLGSGDHMGEIYAASNGMVMYSYDKDDVYRLGGVKDNVTSYGSGWDIEGGGTLAFGPSRTIFSIPPGQTQSILALSDFGERGKPEELGMNFSDNKKPFTPSNPTPTDGAVDQSVTSVQLSWTCSDPDGHALKYDIFGCSLVEGKESAFVPVASQLTESSYTLTGLEEGTEYLWSVVATDGQAIAEGPTWSFTTEGGLSGDVDQDGTITTRDSQWIMQYLVGTRISLPNMDIADVDKDGVITTRDSQWIEQYLVGVRSELKD